MIFPKFPSNFNIMARTSKIVSIGPVRCSGPSSFLTTIAVVAESVSEPVQGKQNSPKSKDGRMLFVSDSFVVETCSDYDSVVDGYENDHAQALSLARLEREVRKCCSDVCLHRFSDNSLATLTETDLRKFPSYECTSLIPKDGEDEETLTSDEILAIAGEQFVSFYKETRLKKSSKADVKSAGKKVASPMLTDEAIPAKRRRLSEEADDGLVDTSSKCRSNLIKNIAKIKTKKAVENFTPRQNRLDEAKTSEELFKDRVANTANILKGEHVACSEKSSLENLILGAWNDDEDYDESCEADSFDSIFYTKGILNTIQETPSNASSILLLTRDFDKGEKLDAPSAETVSDRAEFASGEHFNTETSGSSSASTENNIVNSDGDCRAGKEARLPKDAKSERPRSSDAVLDVTPRFLQLIRQITNAEGSMTPRDVYEEDVDEKDLLRVSRSHCKKLLRVDKDKLGEILSSEPLKLPKIATKAAAKANGGLRERISLPKIDLPSGKSLRSVDVPRQNEESTKRRSPLANKSANGNFGGLKFACAPSPLNLRGSSYVPKIAHDCVCVLGELCEFSDRSKVETVAFGETPCSYSAEVF